MSETKNNNNEIQLAADFIETLNPLIAIGVHHIPILEKTLKNLKKTKDNVVSGAAIIGSEYREKELQLDYRIQRLESLVNLLKIYKESENTIKEISNIKSNQKKINTLFGI